VQALQNWKDKKPAVVVLQRSAQLRHLAMQPCKALQALWLTECLQLATVDLGGLSRLQELHVRGCTALVRVTGLANLPTLRVLELDCSDAAVVRPPCAFLPCAG
jgi:hypothetical protein